MLKTIKIFLAASFLFVATVFAAQASAPSAYAVPTKQQEKLCQGSNTLKLGDPKPGVEEDAASCSATKGSATGLNSLITNIVNIFSVIVGIVAVIMIIYGGFRYITSGGDSGNVGNAKNTILYAIVGLVIVALAQFIVKFVLNKATNAVTTNP